MDIYTAVFDANGGELLKTQAVTVDEKLAEELERYSPLLVFGSGAEKCKEVFKSLNVQFVTGIQSDARFMISLSEAKAVSGQFEDLAYFEPYYLKEFGAKT
jgi:tRNA threonylcarbamoyladenosine biosynthesis protein TsaB